MTLDLAPFAGVRDPAVVRRGFTLYPHGVMAVAARIDDSPVGLAVSAFVSVSLEPPLILLCMDAASTTWPRLRLAPSIGVSVLHEDQAWLGRQLASRRNDRFAGAEFTTTDEGAMLLEGSVARFAGRVVSETPAGDHVMVLLEITEMSADPAERPLIWHDSQFVGLGTPLV